MAMRLLICAVGQSLTAETKMAAESVAVSLIGVGDESCRVAAGAALGALVAHSLTDDETDAALKKNLLSKFLADGLWTGAVAVFGSLRWARIEGVDYTNVLLFQIWIPVLIGQFVMEIVLHCKLQ